MSQILKQAQEHFKSKLAGGLNKMTVPEWKTDVYYKPAYSFAVESKIIELQQQGKTVEALVESIISKALDPEGKPMFTRMDKLTLMNEVDPTVMLKVASVLNSSTTEYDTVIKN